MNIVEKNIEGIIDLCKRHKVRQMFIFGSVLTKRFKKNSDIDFIVDFQGVDLYDYADNYFDLKFSLEDLLNRPVDLIEEPSVTNPYFLEFLNANSLTRYTHSID